MHHSPALWPGPLPRTKRLKVIWIRGAEQNSLEIKATDYTAGEYQSRWEGRQSNWLKQMGQESRSFRTCIWILWFLRFLHHCGNPVIAVRMCAATLQEITDDWKEILQKLQIVNKCGLKKSTYVAPRCNLDWNLTIWKCTFSGNLLKLEVHIKRRERKSEIKIKTHCKTLISVQQIQTPAFELFTFCTWAAVKHFIQGEIWKLKIWEITRN